MRLVGVVVATLKELPVFLAHIMTANLAQDDPRLAHLAALSTYVLALLLVQRIQELFEILVTCVLPMKLHTTAQHETRTFELQGLISGGVKDVRRRQGTGLLHIQQSLHQRIASIVSACHQSCAGHRCEGYGRQ